MSIRCPALPRRRASLPAGACLAGGATPTSPLRFKRLGSLDADELSILALMQDRQGFIWIGTHSGGLYRYNGYQAVRYTSDTRGPAQPAARPRLDPVRRRRDASGPAPRTAWRATTRQTNDFTPLRAAAGPSAAAHHQVHRQRRQGRHVAGHLGRPAALRSGQRQVHALPARRQGQAGQPGQQRHQRDRHGRQAAASGPPPGRADSITWRRRDRLRPPTGSTAPPRPIPSSISCARCTTRATAPCGSAPKSAW
jgi:hypothetical protein